MKKLFTKITIKAGLLAMIVVTTTHVDAQNKKLLGMTAVGKGIFEYDLSAQTLTAKTDFTLNPQDGAGAHGSLIKASDGKIYGMTYNGGINAKGVIFEYNPQTGTNTFKHQFDGTNGENPYGSLCDAGNGKLYGMTSKGGIGINNVGVVFEYVLATGAFSKVIDFTMGLNSNGATPYGSLMKASNGKLYGMTREGGINNSNSGVIFELNPLNNQFTVLAKFGGGVGKATRPFGDLVEAHNGKLYGLAGGGTEGKGCIFEFDIATNIITVKYYWKVTNANNGTTADGANPEGSLCLGKDSLLYGVTKDGGVPVPGTGDGVIFTFNTVTGEYIKKKTLDPILVGSQPRGTLMQASNGKFYGMNYRGGAAQNQYGGLFEYDAINDTVISRHFFNPANFQDAMYGTLLEVDLVTTGLIQTNNVSTIGLYPNPANNEVNIDLEKAPINGIVSITDIQGRVVLTQHLAGKQIQLNIAELHQGLYVVTVTSDALNATQKLIKN